MGTETKTYVQIKTEQLDVFVKIDPEIGSFPKIGEYYVSGEDKNGEYAYVIRVEEYLDDSENSETRRKARVTVISEKNAIVGSEIEVNPQ